MYARNVTSHLSPDKIDEAIQMWQETVAPFYEQHKGFKKAYLLVDRSTGKARTVSLWETEADLKAGDQWNQEIIARFARFFTLSPVVEQFEVAAEV